MCIQSLAVLWSYCPPSIPYRDFNEEGRHYHEMDILNHTICDLILKGKLRLCQLTGMNPIEIIVPFAKEEISSLWAENENWQRAYNNFLGEINNSYLKSEKPKYIKRTGWILPWLIWGTPISGYPRFYIDANKPEKVGYK